MYVFITTDGKYVGIDNASGGYPYTSDRPLTAYPWATIDEAKNYQKHFDSTWILKKLNGLNLSDVSE